MSDFDAVLDQLTTTYPQLSPQLKRAAKYVLDCPAEVAINSMRKVALSADVGPSTMLRLAKRLGYESYEDFRLPFREALRSGGGSFTGRVEMLRSLEGSAREGEPRTERGDQGDARSRDS